MRNNNAIFQRIWEQCKDKGLSFISSNGGTGKTTYFIVCRLLRDAIYRHIHFNVYVRFGYEREIMAEKLLTPQPTYSNRMRKALAECEVEKDGDKFVFIKHKASGRRIAQIVDVNGQAFYKRFGNMIGATRAVFDEVLAEDGAYCSDELNKFCRLNFTMARTNEYHVYCLYNNTSPNFPYFTFFCGKSYNTHISKSGAYFVYFTAQQYGKSDELPQLAIQSIIQRTDYNAVYASNKFTVYPTFHQAISAPTQKCFRLLIDTRLFWVCLSDNYIYLTRAKNKPCRKNTYTINDIDTTTIPQIPPEIEANLATYIDFSRVKTPILQDTIFCKKLCEAI